MTAPAILVMFWNTKSTPRYPYTAIDDGCLGVRLGRQLFETIIEKVGTTYDSSDTYSQCHEERDLLENVVLPDDKRNPGKECCEYEDGVPPRRRALSTNHGL